MHSSLKVVILVQGLLYHSYAFVIPHVGGIGTDLNILTDNDLAGNTTFRTEGAILLSSAVTHKIAAQTCNSLNEKLWSLTPDNFDKRLNNSLSYIAYLNNESRDSTGRYWIRNENNSTSCSALTKEGHIVALPCDESLPALCTQSAPMAYAAWANTSSVYHVSQDVGKQTLTGFRDFHNFRFHGVRFAPEPRRFEFSTLYEGEGNSDAFEYGYDCIQADPSSPGTKKKLKPVMFWIYGGGNTEGSGTDPEKEGGQLASRGDVVVVEFSYRLGALGWLTFNDGVHDGNYGASDMLNALKWTHKYIKYLGGDPDRITIFGESAGASGVRQLLTTPLAEGLISGAIMQSVPGAPIANGDFANYSEPLRWYEKFTKRILEENGRADATDEVACMRAGDPHEWAASGRTHMQNPSRDGVIIPYSGLPVSGPLATHRDLPMAIGTTRDEIASALPRNVPLNFTKCMALINGFLEVDMIPLAQNPIFNPELQPRWPSLSEAEQRSLLFNNTQRVISELALICPTTALAYSASKNNVFNAVYQFEFNRTYLPNSEAPFEAQEICGRFVESPDLDEYYKCHAGDNPVVFGNFAFLGWPERDGTDVLFSRYVVDYWSAFARSGKMKLDPEYLRARGFWSTEYQLGRTGEWEEVDFSSGSHRIMSLQWTGQGMIEWAGGQEERCQVLGYPRDYYENVDFEN